MQEMVEEWIIVWFSNQTGVSREEVEKNKNTSYFSTGWLDSFSFISFITACEETYNIRFTNDSFQDRGFSTIEGLAKIITKLKNGDRIEL